MGSAAKRPMSPHLWIYRWQWTMVLSITHRATGVGVCGGAVLLALWLAAAAAGPKSFEAAQWIAGSWIGLLALLGWTWALFYHLCNGIRHLLWDIGVALDLPNAERGAYVVVAASALLTVIAWVFGLAMWW
jgi:succinate dehydrogenase / fumarate reductase, cytochrome b subunit